MKKLLLIVFLFMVISTFKTGCTRNAEASNVMITDTSSFTVISDVVVVSESPPNGSSGVARNTTIDISFVHTLPVVSSTLTVTADGTPWSGSVVITDIPQGKRLIWTPDNDFPMNAVIIRKLDVEVDNGL